jgi:hypothetical protein
MSYSHLLPALAQVDLDADTSPNSDWSTDLQTSGVGSSIPHSIMLWCRWTSEIVRHEFEVSMPCARAAKGLCTT